MSGVMTRLSLLATLALCSATGTATAQAPGDTPAQVPVDGHAGARVPVMAHRFAVGLGLGGMGIAPNDDPEAKTDFTIGQLALRYRATRHLELEVTLAGGRQTVDGEEGDLAIGTFAIGARWRFAPERRWNWFAGAGIGAATIARHDATDEQRDAASRPTAHVAVGIERRFRRLALQAELRLVGIGSVFENDNDAMPAARATSSPAAELGGGMFTLGAGYYF